MVMISFHNRYYFLDDFSITLHEAIVYLHKASTLRRANNSSYHVSHALTMQFLRVVDVS